MDRALKEAFVTGYERMAAWSDLLDDINLYPVADADTGRNLRVSLAPLKTPDHRDTVKRLLLGATGNSGNIAGAFFSEFTTVESSNQLGSAARAGRENAWKSLLNPKSGTILTVFDTLADCLDSNPPLIPIKGVSGIVDQLKGAVVATAEILPELRQANVVDAGALGMFIFFEGFLRYLAGETHALTAPTELFGSRLSISGRMVSQAVESYCIDTVIRPTESPDAAARMIAAFAEQIVAVSDRDHLKIHFHAADAEMARTAVSAAGTVVRWETEKIEVQNLSTDRGRHGDAPVHIVTDAAGSLTRATARDLGVTLLESYILFADKAIPETLVSPEELYAAMRQGVKVTTAQASTFERHQYYESLLHRHREVIYLCVGSAYTGNHEVARHWAASNGAGSRFTVIDTTAAAGRLGLLARHVARFAETANSPAAVIDHALDVIPACEEIIFLDQLKFLAEGGRISKTKGFFGDLFHVKPVISPSADGVKKIGTVKNRAEQLRFAVDYLENRLTSEPALEILLTYTDNREWVVETVVPRIKGLLPIADVHMAPLSLTSGVHMGPGAWSVAFLMPPVEKPAPENE